jgi:spore coat polysaccharide biosynthesis predicted glycosyltransferase SpsG
MKFRFFLFILLLSVANAFASDLDFTLVNQTARSFEGVYITASDNEDWDANLLLNGKVLTAGGKIQVRFKNDAKSETWDFNLVDDEGLSVTFDKVKLAGVDTVTLKDVNGKITAEIE